ncbi:SLC13 family permease [Nosocomiicoccus ampullae]|uniref:Di/tricarboxylate transporter n=1 Tax=Nosocomiicoccus ampullae TaxID=489910 RepID=A0A9Q2HG22_9STAP|nr:SLC13 family permease [Nosocomiicoccus ampullae]MBB5176097.1 di/tricarboxylate transporter [Nosocomiicoccus ampullae]QYA47270.1 SLC13 family permease [Nosocomiicoccus ampullae]
MTLEMLFVLVMIIIMLMLLLFEVIRADFVVFLFLVIFLMTNMISTEDALSGFSNEGLMTILLLFIVASAIEKHGVIEGVIYKLLGDNTSPRMALLKLLPPVGVASGFLNNTPIVLALTPVIKDWALKRGFSPSKFLIPLSYITIIGGTLTLIGTSTNLIIHGLLISDGKEGYSFFQLAPVGIFILIVGLIYLVTIGYKLLPTHLGATEKIESETKEFLAEAEIGEDFEYCNHSVLDVTKHALKGIYIIEIIREKRPLPEVNAYTYVQAGDRIIFSATLESIGNIKDVKGLTLRTGSELTLDDLQTDDTVLIEAVVSHRSILVGKTLKSSQFKTRYQAGVIAIHRNNKRINSKVGDIVLKPGDTLLLLANESFLDVNRYSDDFYIVTNLTPPDKFIRNKRQGLGVLLLLGVMISFVVLGILSMLKAMLVMVVILSLLKLITPRDVVTSVQFDVILLIGSAFGVGKAITNSGLASFVAEHIVDFAKPLGLIALLTALYIITNIFTELITNSAAAVIMYPIAIEVAEMMNVHYLGMVIAVTIAASSSFITPIGYQTNLIVYGPGGYKFTDYIKVGVPLSIITMIISVIAIYFLWF